VPEKRYGIVSPIPIHLTLYASLFFEYLSASFAAFPCNKIENQTDDNAQNRRYRENYVLEVACMRSYGRHAVSFSSAREPA
jgi:hypothetical protein